MGVHSLRIRRMVWFTIWQLSLARPKIADKLLDQRIWCRFALAGAVSQPRIRPEVGMPVPAVTSMDGQFDSVTVSSVRAFPQCSGRSAL
jgi:hypothetical protein